MKRKKTEIVYGTTNVAKIEWMKSMTENLDIDIISIGDLGTDLPDIDEDGKDPLENAIKKAKTYYDIIKRPVLSADSGLYFIEVSDEDQPGTMIRRVGGKSLSDNGMVEYYCSLAKKYGGKLTAQYRNALALVVDSDTMYTCYDDSVASEQYYIVSQPHSGRRAGFPLDCMSVEIESGEYYNDLDHTKYILHSDDAYANFFKGALPEIEDREDDE